jgi:integrase
MVSGDPKNQYQDELTRLEEACAGDSEPKPGRKKRLDTTTDTGSVSTADADAIREFLSAKDANDVTVVESESDSMEYSTLATYCQALRVTATRAQTPLTEATADEINELMQSIVDGTHPSVKDDGLSKNTVIQHQSALRKFYRYHDDLGVNDDKIVIFQRPTTSVDDRDMFTREEIEAMRDVIDNPRDRCLFELMVNTGQRVRAIQTLRIKDVDTEEGVFYLNTDADGLKGADKSGRKRPLLGAKRPVYDWLQFHPTGEPDDFLITARPSANRGRHGEQLHQTSINRILKNIATEAGVEKPKNAHQFRHFFVTVAKRDYGLDNDTIKHLIGHAPDSKVMETTYAHLTDDDYIRNAEVGADLREPEEPDTLTPNICPTCDTQLEPSAKACPGCGNVFAPDARDAKEQMESDMKNSYKQVDPDDDETIEALETVEEMVEERMSALLDDPDFLEQQLERAKED